MKKHYHFLLLILFNLNIYAFDACSEFLRIAKLESNQSTLNSKVAYEMPTLQPKVDIDAVTIDSPGKYLRSDDNRIYPDRILVENPDYYYYEGDEVLSINGKKTSLMTDEEILDELFKDQDTVDIELILDGEFVDDDGNAIPPIRKLNIDAYSIQTLLVLDLEIKNVEKIDSATSTYKTRYKTRIDYYLDDEIMMNIIEEILQNPSNMSYGDDTNLAFLCTFSEKQINSIGIWTPQVRPANIVSMEGDSTSINYEFWAYKNYEHKFVQNGDYISTFRSSFNFTTFPFDKQSLVFIFQDEFQEAYLRFNENTNSYMNSFDNIEIYDWTKTNYQTSRSFENSFWGTYNALTYRVNIERNSIYFLTKIFLPILIILSLSFCVLWIKPEQLQARLTVSVVCFLALITYTFIIDKDLPKLAYLTVMDYVILISYLFAAVPTIESVVVSTYESNEKGEYIDRNYRILLPILYITISFVLILTSIVLNLENTKAFLN